MANRKSFLGALWDGDLIAAAGALVAGILHIVVMGVFLLGLTAVSPLLAVLMPFYAYQLGSENIEMFTFAYFFLGGFASAIFTNIVYCRLTRKERRARGETFGQHCRNVAGWPTLSIICSWITSGIYTAMFKDSLLWVDSNMAHAVFFAMAPIAVFSPLWIYLIRRYRQKAAMEELHRKFVALRQQRDAEFLREQGMVG